MKSKPKKRRGNESFSIKTKQSNQFEIELAKVTSLSPTSDNIEDVESLDNSKNENFASGNTLTSVSLGISKLEDDLDGKSLKELKSMTKNMTQLRKIHKQLQKLTVEELIYHVATNITFIDF